MRESKYGPLERWLMTSAVATITTTFATLDALINGLPDSARKYQAYWYGRAAGARTHIQKQAWERAGFTVQTVDLSRELVTFKRIATGTDRKTNIDTGRDERHSTRASTHLSGDSQRGALAGTDRSQSSQTQLETLRAAGFQPLTVLSVDSDAHGMPLLSYPEMRFQNVRGLRPHAYGTGPFCRFRVNLPPRQRGVYVLEVARAALYIGIAEDLAKRFNAGYGNISPRNCYDGGQSTNCRINQRILAEASAGREITLWFLPLLEPLRPVESTLIEALRPPWNIQGAEPLPVQP